MDEKNVCADGIDDRTMQEMLSRSDVRLVISSEMQSAYEWKYGMKFWIMPPLVPEDMLRHDPVPTPKPSTPVRDRNREMTPLSKVEVTLPGYSASCAKSHQTEAGTMTASMSRLTAAARPALVR